MSATGVSVRLGILETTVRDAALWRWVYLFVCKTHDMHVTLSSLSLVLCVYICMCIT